MIDPSICFDNFITFINQALEIIAQLDIGPIMPDDMVFPKDQN